MPRSSSLDTLVAESTRCWASNIWIDVARPPPGTRGGGCPEDNSAGGRGGCPEDNPVLGRGLAKILIINWDGPGRTHLFLLEKPIGF